MIDATAVREVLQDCLFRENELGKDGRPVGIEPVLVEGVHIKLGFHPDRVKANKEKIRSFLKELPAAFHKEGGGGWSFLNMCLDKDDQQWGQHQNVDELIALGLATKMVSFCLPRDMWSALPGGVPYVVVDTSIE